MQHIVNLSGGKDSTATYLLALERLDGNFIPVYADTGNENAITLDYIDRIAERTGGPKVQTVRADFTERLAKRRSFIWKNYPRHRVADALSAIDAALRENSPMFSLAVWKGMFPSNVKRFCTSELKVIPIYEQVILPLLESGKKVISWQGIRAEESAARSRMKQQEEIDEGLTVYRPILDWSVPEVFAIHNRHGLEPNPLYKLGMGRVGCFPCIMARKAEIGAIVRRFPEHIDKIRFWKNTVQKAGRTGVSTYFPCTKVPGVSDMRACVDNVAAWATGTVRGQLQFPIEIPLAGCHSEYGLCG